MNVYFWKCDDGRIECVNDNVKTWDPIKNLILGHIPKLSFTKLISPFIHNYHFTFTTMVLGFGLWALGLRSCLNRFVEITGGQCVI